MVIGMLDKIKNIIMLQGVIVIYTISSIMSKLASGSEDNLLKFLFFFGMEFLILGVYAVLWQQLIKRFELSVAYANRSMSILWSMIWAVVFFQDKITTNNILGILIVIAGTIIINTEVEEQKGD